MSLSDPPVACAIMLARDRKLMSWAAIDCFRAQNYRNKRLLLFDTSPTDPIRLEASADEYAVWVPYLAGQTIGALRNAANAMAAAKWDPKILLHWDSDDVCDPRRMRDQVGDLERTQAQIVGYHSLMFVDVQRTPVPSVWLYQGYPGYCIGASLCYWTETWRERNFPDQNIGEDTEFCMERNTFSVGSTDWPFMMACRMHAGSTSQRSLERFARGDVGPFVPVTDRRAAQAREMVGGLT